MVFKCYTDGSALNNGKPDAKGGWSFVAIDKNGTVVKEEYGSEIGTTNNRMELMGVIFGLNYAIVKADIGELIEIYTDSAYVVNCIKEQWYKKWDRNGWKASNGSPVKNRDLWEILIKDLKICKDSVRILKVKGHDGDKYNERADVLAVKGSKEARLLCTK